MHLFILSCGHVQAMKCHVEPEDFVCQVACSEVLSCGHVCQEVCGRPCTTECKELVERSWPCGHQLTVACYRTPDKFPCRYKMERMLPCGHSIAATCSEDLTRHRCQRKVYTYCRTCMIRDNFMLSVKSLSRTTFRQKLKTHLFRQSYPDIVFNCFAIVVLEVSFT